VTVQGSAWTSGGELYLRLVPPALVPPTAVPAGVVVPAAAHGIEIRVTSAGGSREIRDRRSDFVMPADRMAELTTRLPERWLNPGRYLVAIHVGGEAEAVAAPFEIDVR